MASAIEVRDGMLVCRGCEARFWRKWEIKHNGFGCRHSDSFGPSTPGNGIVVEGVVDWMCRESARENTSIPYLATSTVQGGVTLHWDRMNRSRTGPVARQWHPSLQATRDIPRTLMFGLVVDPPTANGAAYQNSERNSDLRDDLTPPVAVSASLSAGWT